MVICKEPTLIEQTAKAFDCSHAKIDCRLTHNEVFNVHLRRELIYAQDHPKHWIILEGYKSFFWAIKAEELNSLLDENRKMIF